MRLRRPPSRWHGYFTMPVAVGLVNSVLGAGALAFAMAIATGAPLGVSIVTGLAIALGSFACHYRHSERRFRQAVHGDRVGRPLFPSPTAQ